MTEKPILMTAENYSKCQDGTKTQTRRVVMPQPELIAGLWHHNVSVGNVIWDEYGGPEKVVLEYMLMECPYPAGTRLWVKEPFRIHGVDTDGNVHGEYKYGGGFGAYYGECRLTATEYAKWLKWKEPYKGKSALFMFKSLARLWLEVTAVRVERLQEISIKDCRLEGIEDAVPNPYGISERTLFRDLWDSINKDRAPWSINPWVWVYTFIKN